MKRFILKNIVFFGILFMAVLPPTLLYIKRDVYEDFGYHKNYSWKYNFQGLGISRQKNYFSHLYLTTRLFSEAAGVRSYTPVTSIRKLKIHASFTTPIGLKP